MRLASHQRPGEPDPVPTLPKHLDFEAWETLSIFPIPYSLFPALIETPRRSPPNPCYPSLPEEVDTIEIGI